MNEIITKGLSLFFNPLISAPNPTPHDLKCRLRITDADDEVGALVRIRAQVCIDLNYKILEP